MAELMVCRVDVVHPDPLRDPQCFKRGDVIEVLPDGSDWGMEAIAHPGWIVVCVPDMDVDEASAFLAPERSQDGIDSPMLQKRGFKLDLDSSLIDKRGLRAAVDDLTVLTAVGQAEVEVVVSKIEEPTATVKADAKEGEEAIVLTVTETEVSREVVRFETVDAGVAVAQAMEALPSIAKVGPRVRKSVAVALTADDVRSLQVQKPPLTKRDFGFNPRIF